MASRFDTETTQALTEGTPEVASERTGEVDRVDADRRRDIGEREGFGEAVVQKVAGLAQPSRWSPCHVGGVGS
jgi:hypothetical protein